MSKIKYISKLLQTKQISCTELTNKYLGSIEEENKILNAYVKVTYDEALRTAKIVDNKIQKGEKLKPLEGIPMTLKDNISTRGIETTCCSKMLKNYFPVFDATVWEILKKQNSVLLGKTNMDEFAMGSSCDTSIFGGTANPYDINRVAGGSSGGTASAVAANIAVYGLGSDTGGSVRQPASFCGLVGFKPTYGTVSRYGLISYSSSMDQIGPLSTTVEDASIIYDEISMYDKKDSTSVGSKVKTSELLNNSIDGVKIGIINEFFEGINDEIKNNLEGALKVYEDLGAEIIEISIPEIKYILPVYYITAFAEASSNLARYDGIRYGYRTSSFKDVDEMICKTRNEGFGKEVKKRIMLGTYVLSSDNCDVYFKKSQDLRKIIKKTFSEVFNLCNIILTPTVPTTAFKRELFTSDVKETHYNDICATAIANLLGLPAVSLPCGFDSEGLPIGMQLMGRNFDDALILNVAYQFEKNTKLIKCLDMGVRL